MNVGDPDAIGRSSDNTREYVPCAGKVDLISCLLDNELSPEEREGLQRHIEICTGCRGYAAALEKDIALFEARFSTVHARSDFTERVMNETRTESKREVGKMSERQTVTEASHEQDTVPASVQPVAAIGRDLFKPIRGWLHRYQWAAGLALCLALMISVFTITSTKVRNLFVHVNTRITSTTDESPSILRPSFVPFSRSREKARTSSCQSNLKQIGLAFQMFESDNGHLPTATDWTRQLVPYVGSPQIFVCPIMPPGYGYAMNPALSGRSLKNLPNPAEVILAFDAENGVVSFRHNDGVNVLFADGHLKWLSRKDFEKSGVGASSLSFPLSGGTIQNVEKLGRHVAYEANLSLESSGPAAVMCKMEATIEQCGGFLINSHLAIQDEDDRLTGTLAARVPRSRFSEAVNAITALGRVRKREIAGEDVTESYVAAQQNLGESNASATRIATMTPRRLSQQLVVEDRLHETAKSRVELRKEASHLVGMTELATINVTVMEPLPPSFWPPAFEAAKRFVKQTAYWVYVACGCLLICAPLWLPAVGAWWLWHRRQQRVAATA